ncbi:hypothetical protein [Planococcus shenhongbingii]|uniref:Uncharacterized protein n=1 Tax=Planococcus shenhongbingii TaxID=3058398 RepID=A0ABT8NE14_9BACL|nr:hypothetical protein [Planococcus sp. N017]MDN7246081.1 hypothetical protein [Planococcus sp. N017]
MNDGIYLIDGQQFFSKCFNGFEDTGMGINSFNPNFFISIVFLADKEKEQKRALKWNVFAGFYILFLLIFLSLLGGNSSRGFR